MAEGIATLISVLIFVICLVVLIFDLNRLNYSPEGYSFWIWLIIIIPRSVIMGRIYYKLTSKDPDRDDFDFSE